MEVNFPDSFFKGEEREGFYVTELMKRAWAAQLVVLSEIDKVCKKLRIKWYADSGTLLGAVRHKGFIPWDDDIDIAMLRPDYNLFIKEAKKYLPNPYLLLNIHTFPKEYDDYLTRVVNHYYEYPPLQETLDKYYGFPFVCGVDIVPLDYIPRDPGQLEVFNNLIELLAYGANVCELPDADPVEIDAMLVKVHEFTGVEIDKRKNVPNQLRVLMEKVSGMYTHREADRVGYAIRQSVRPDYNWPKQSFFKPTELEFEGIMIPVPSEYEFQLENQYGKEYMKPVRYESHDYPFYKREMKEYGLSLEE